MNQSAGNLRHFPLENIDSTAIFAVFPGKVNPIPTNLRHFPRPPHTHTFPGYEALGSFGTGKKAKAKLNKFIFITLGFCVYLTLVYLLFTINMKIINRLSFLLCVFLLGHGSVYSQTHADVKMGEILNSADLFQIREQYPILKDSLSIGMLNLVSEAQLGIGFNKLERAGSALDSLLQFHQTELGAETSVGMAALRAMNLLNLGLYSQAGKAGEDLVNALKDVLPFESLYSFVFIERVGKALSNCAGSYLERPSRDITVPMKCDTVGRGFHFYIPVEVNGITKDYIFDTGCSFGNFVSEEYAEEVGLKIISDSIPVSGMDVGFVKLAVADSLKVGEIVYHNPIFMVAPPDEDIDSVFTFDGVLGYHFIRDVGEVIVDNESGAFVFPYQISDGEPNMFLSSNTPKVRIEYEGQPFDMVFDTGNVKSNLGNEFVQMFPETLSGLPEHESSFGGFGGVSKTEAVTLPEFVFSLSGQPITLRDTEVWMGPSSGSQLFYSSLGADFILSFRRLVINYKNMFVRGEAWP